MVAVVAPAAPATATDDAAALVDVETTVDASATGAVRGVSTAAAAGGEGFSEAELTLVAEGPPDAATASARGTVGAEVDPADEGRAAGDASARATALLAVA
jgi:hypothetical protein